MKIKLTKVNSLFRKRLLFKIMRTFIFLLCTTVFGFTTDKSFSQEKVTIDVDKVVPVDEVFSIIQKQTKYRFIYPQDMFSNVPEVQLKKGVFPVSKLLEQSLAGSNVNFKLSDDNTIVIKENRKTETLKSVAAQQHQVSGTISDQLGLPLPSANIMEKGTNNGVQSDLEGKFKINVKSPNAVLVVSFLGFQAKEIAVNNQTIINIVLQDATTALIDVVVVGYGKQKKSNIVGAVSSIGGAEIMKTQTANIGNNLTGRVAGLVINQRGGQPGEDNVGILIRGLSTTGNSSPLIVIDGIPNRGSFERLNPEDVESISVLKDASAAIYGAQSANGVILVTTKRGKKGETVFNFNNSYSISQPTRSPQYMNALQYLTWKDELSVRNGNPPIWKDLVRQYRDGTVDKTIYGDTNWWDQIVEEWTPQIQNSISARGGGENVQFSLSAQMLNQDAIYKGNAYGYKQLNVRSNIDAKLSKTLKIGFDIAARIGETNRPTTDPRDLIGQVINQRPYEFPYFENGLLKSNGSGNPIPNVNGQSGYKDTYDRKFDSKFSFRYDLQFIKGLYIDGYAAIDYYNTFRKELFKPYDIYTYDTKTDVYTNIRIQESRTSSTFRSFYEQIGITPHFKIGYDATFGKHILSSFIAYEQYKRYGEDFYSYRQGLVTPDLPYLNFASDVNQNIGGTGSQTARQNYFGRVNYSYNEKYLLDLTLRYDGSVNFPRAKRFGFYPAASLGWKISKESFFDSKLISNLKLRASFGILGNDAVPNFQYFQTYGLNNNSFIFGDPTTRTLGLTPNVLPNPNITWETSHKTNIGLDFGLINGLLDITVDAFYEKRSDILAKRNASVPTYTGIVLPDENFGEVENKGIEFQLNHRGSIGDDFKYNIGGQLTYARSKIIYIDEPTNIPEWQRRTGKPIDYLLVYKADGIFQNQQEINNYPHWNNAKPGDVKFVDVNGDGAISQQDQIILDQSPTPRLVYGVTMGADWKNFSLNILFQGQGEASTIYKQWDVNQHAYFYNNRWISEEKTPNAIYPATWGLGDTDFDENSTIWVKNNTFIRLKNIELSYNLNKEMLKKCGISGLRLFVSAHNLFIISDKVKFDDPESNVSDGRYYPQQRLISTGVNLNF